MFLFGQSKRKIKKHIAAGDLQLTINFQQRYRYGTSRIPNSNLNFHLAISKFSVIQSKISNYLGMKKGFVRRVSRRSAQMEGTQIYADFLLYAGNGSRDMNLDKGKPFTG